VEYPDTFLEEMWKITEYLSYIDDLNAYSVTEGFPNKSLE
jgi:hypothetical protein